MTAAFCFKNDPVLYADKFLTELEIEADMAFLLRRAMWAGRCPFGPDREVGLSSNDLVRFAYTGQAPDHWPYDASDYAACEEAYRALPEHRQTSAVRKKLREMDRFMQNGHKRGR